MANLRNWVVLAGVLVILLAACSHLLQWATRTEPSRSGIVQAFLDRDEIRDATVTLTVSSPHLDSLLATPVSKAIELVSAAKFDCAQRQNKGDFHCRREFYTVAGPCFWEVSLSIDDRHQVKSIIATRIGQCPDH